jgi:hypothetical protein
MDIPIDTYVIIFGIACSWYSLRYRIARCEDRIAGLEETRGN